MAEGRPAGPSVDHGREPCPDRILDDIGGAFGMGAVGGGLWHLIKGLKNSPRNARMRGGVEAIRREAPKIGGSFAVWGGLFSTFDCTLVALRRKAMIEGLGILLTRMTAPPPAPPMLDMPPPNSMPASGPQPSIASTSGLPQSTEAPAMPSFTSDSAAQQQDGQPEKSSFFSSWFGGSKKDAEEVKVKELAGDTFELQGEPQFR